MPFLCLIGLFISNLHIDRQNHPFFFLNQNLLAPSAPVDHTSSLGKQKFPSHRTPTIVIRITQFLGEVFYSHYTLFISLPRAPITRFVISTLFFLAS